MDYHAKILILIDIYIDWTLGTQRRFRMHKNNARHLRETKHLTNHKGKINSRTSKLNLIFAYIQDDSFNLYIFLFFTTHLV